MFANQDIQKALNIFNAALVTPTYYVYFTSTTIISSAILFRGFKGTPTSIITVVLGFLTICSGVVLLQLSKSAKDVPDSAVFAGDLDQIHTIAEQPQPETEPKADAIRGAAAIVRRLSSARQKMELDELKRIREEKLQESLEPVTENGVPQYQWDGLRRRRTGTFSTYRSATPATTHLAPPTPHLPLGWSHLPTEEELAEANRPVSPALSSIVGTIRTRARSVLLPGHPEFRKTPDPSKVQSPMHPVQLTSIAVPGSKPEAAHDYTPPGTSASTRHVQFGEDSRKASDGAESAVSHLAPTPPTPPPHSGARRQFSFQSMFKRHQQPHSSEAAHDTQPHHHHRRHNSRPSSSRHGGARGYSSPQLRGATEEETLGLVKGDSNTNRNEDNQLISHSTPALAHYQGSSSDDDDDDDDGIDTREKYRDDPIDKQARYGHSITRGYTHARTTSSPSPPRSAHTRTRTRTRTPMPSQPGAGNGSGGPEEAGRREREDDEKWEEDEIGEYEKLRKRFVEQRRSSAGGAAGRSGSGSSGGSDRPPPPPPPHGGSYGSAGGRMGSFI